MGDDRYAVHQVAYGSDGKGNMSQTDNYMKLLNAEGELGNVNLKKALLEQKLIRSHYDSLELSSEMYMDAAGYIFMWTNKGHIANGTIYVFDPEGAFVLLRDAENDGQFMEPMRTQTGEYIFGSSNRGGKSTFFLYL